MSLWRSLRNRVVTAAVAWVVVAAVLVVVVLDVVRRDDQAEQMRSTGKALSALITPVLERALAQSNPETVAAAARGVIAEGKLLGITVLDPRHRVLAAEPAATRSIPLLTAWPRDPAQACEVQVGTLHGLGQFSTLRGNDASSAGCWLVIDCEPVESANRRFHTLAILILVGVVGLTMVVGTLAADAIVTPIDRLGMTAAALVRGQLNARHEVEGPEEIQRLARRLNRVADWLEASSAHISRIAADLDRQVQVRMREMEETNRRLSELANTDQLTGLINRRGLEIELSRYLTLARRYNQKLGVIMMDLDNFKVYNDRCGHLAGDTVLRAVGDALRHKARSSDVVSRWGGDEFCILIPATDGPGVLAAAQRYVIAVLESLGDLSHSDVSATLGCSAGVACYPDHGDEAKELIARADAALYRVKATGGSKVMLAVVEEVSEALG